MIPVFIRRAWILGKFYAPELIFALMIAIVVITFAVKWTQPAPSAPATVPASAPSPASASIECAGGFLLRNGDIVVRAGQAVKC